MPLFEDTNWDGIPPNLGVDYSRVVTMTAAQIASPTAQQLEDLEAIYLLNVSPFTRYFSNGTTLVEVLSAAATTAQIAAIQTEINAIKALIGASNSPSKPTATTNVSFAGALSPNAQQTITPAKWSGTAVTVSSASPAVVTWASHGLSIGGEVIFNASSMPTGLTAGQVYYIISAGFTTGAFQVSASPGGAAINTSSTGTSVTVDNVIPSSRVWHVYVNGNIDSFPNRVIPLFTPGAGTGGLPAFVVEEATARNGSGQVQSTSAPVTITAPSTFTVSVVQATISGTEGQAITPVAPVLASGATGSISYTTTPSLAGTGFAINSSTGVISGTRTLGLGALTGTYTVNATDSATSPDFISAQFAFNIAASSVTALSSLPYPVPTNMEPRTSPSYSEGGTITDVNGFVRLQRVSDPLGSGQLVYLHRIPRADFNPGSNSVRSEKLWIDQNKPLNPGIDYWMSFAMLAQSGSWHTTGGGDEEWLFFQTHSQTPALSYPDISAVEQLWSTAGVKWKSSYADTEDGAVVSETTRASTALTSTSQWTKYIIHYRPGYKASQSPRYEVWRKVGTGAYTKIVDDSNLNTYNTSVNGSTVTISNASPAVVTRSSHGLSINDPVIFNTSGSLPTGLVAGDIYYVSANGFNANSFQVSSTVGGASINTSSAGSGTHRIGGEKSYPRIGLYFYSSTSTWNVTSTAIGCYMTSLYYGVGADLYDEAEAAIAAL